MKVFQIYWMALEHFTIFLYNRIQKMNGHDSDLRRLIHALVNPISNEQYQRDQQTVTDLFKQPGELDFLPLSSRMNIS